MTIEDRIHYYNYLLKSNNKEAYLYYMRSSYILHLRSSMIKIKDECHFCQQKKHLFPFLLKVKLFNQTPFKDIVLSCNSCKHKHFSIRKLYPQPLKYGRRGTNLNSLDLQFNREERKQWKNRHTAPIATT